MTANEAFLSVRSYHFHALVFAALAHARKHGKVQALTLADCRHLWKAATAVSIGPICAEKFGW